MGSPRVRSVSPARSPRSDVALAGEHDVLRLQITMDDAGLVRLCERIGQLTGDLKGFLQRQPSTSEQLPEGGAVDELHHDEELAVELPEVVDRDDPRVIQCGRRSRFVLKAPERARVGEASTPRTLMATCRPSLASRAR